MFTKLKRIIKNEHKQKQASRKGGAEYRKNGVRKLVSDEEIFDAFNAEEALAEERAATEERPVQFKEEIPGVEKKKAVPKKNVDKNGFPILDGAGDLSKLMGETIEDTGDSDESAGNEARKRVVPVKSLKTKHGIPVLKNDDDYTAIFTEEDPVADFNEILVESLGDKSFEVLLREKRDRMEPSKKLTVKQRLSRYPLPQGQLDLHGYTAIKADLKVESYLKNAFHNGTYTVRLIVGKGLHSEEGPVLPDVVEKRVLRMKQENVVFAYEWDTRKKSKSGSLTVYLNNYYKA